MNYDERTFVRSSTWFLAIMQMLRTIPALPVKNITESCDFYRDKLGFEVVHQEAGFAIVKYDEAEIHLWQSADESWKTRSDLNVRPVVSGAESFIAGTASCRIQVKGVEELYVRYKPLEVLHPRFTITIEDTWWGTREFAVVDIDNNLLTFFENIH